MICCPMTTQIKNNPFEVLIAGTLANVVLADQVKSLDWRVRKATRKGAVPAEELAEVRAKILVLIGQVSLSFVPLERVGADGQSAPS